MLLAFPTDAVHPASVSDSNEDADPHERHVAEVINFEEYRQHTDNIVRFPIIVDETLSEAAQQIVHSSCPDSITEVRVELMLKKRQSKIWISMKVAAYSIALHAIIFGLPSAEFGPVTHVSKTTQA